jgi:hypothetical protein
VRPAMSEHPLLLSAHSFRTLLPRKINPELSCYMIFA